MDTARPADSRSFLLSSEEAAARIHPDLAPRTLERWRMTGRGPRYVRIGRRVGYTEQAILDWLARQEHQHTAQERPARRYDDPEAA